MMREEEHVYASFDSNQRAFRPSSANFALGLCILHSKSCIVSITYHHLCQVRGRGFVRDELRYMYLSSITRVKLFLELASLVRQRSRSVRRWVPPASSMHIVLAQP